MKQASSCARWQHLLETLLTEESLSPKEQADLKAHLAECAPCAQLDEQRQAILSDLRARATVVPLPERMTQRFLLIGEPRSGKRWLWDNTPLLPQHVGKGYPLPVRHVSSHRTRTSTSGENTYKLSLARSAKGTYVISIEQRRKQRRAKVLSHVTRFLRLTATSCGLILFWAILWAVFSFIIVRSSIHQPLPAAGPAQEALFEQAARVHATILNFLTFDVFAGCVLSLMLLLSKGVRTYMWNVLTRFGFLPKRRPANELIVWFDQRERNNTPDMLYLKYQNGENVLRSTKLYASGANQKRASFSHVRPGFYVLFTSPATKELAVSIDCDQVVTIEWDQMGEQASDFSSPKGATASLLSPRFPG